MKDYSGLVSRIDRFLVSILLFVIISFVVFCGIFLYIVIIEFPQIFLVSIPIALIYFLVPESFIKKFLPAYQLSNK